MSGQRLSRAERYAHLRELVRLGLVLCGTVACVTVPVVLAWAVLGRRSGWAAPLSASGGVAAWGLLRLVYRGEER